MRKRNRAYKKAKGKPRDHPVWELHRRLCREKKAAIAKAKEERLNKLAKKINGGTNSEKEWWSLARDIYRPKADTDGSPLEYEGEIIHDQKRKADIFNKYFAEMSTLDGDNDPIPLISEEPPETPGLSNLRFDQEEVVKAIGSMRTNSATGYDGISYLALKKTSESTKGILCRLFNACMKRGIMPKTWKKANLTPIHKKNNLSDVKNYRPISLLSCLSKVIERLVCDRLRVYLEENNLITDAQYGFRRGSSTLDQLLDLYDNIMKNMDEKMVTKLLFLDVSKAFDKVWHKGLIYKLKRLGIEGDLLEFFKDYLEDRQQRVALKGALSSWITIKAGVPQGSIMGPILFLIYTNDLPSEIQSIIKMFADDTILGATGKTSDECSNILQPNIDQLAAWAKKWKIKLNPSKTKCLTISRKKNMYSPLILNNRIVEEVKHHCHLGLRLQDNGKWKIQIDHMISRASKRLGIMKAYGRKFGRKPLLKIYLAYIRPILEYGDYIWSNLSKSEEDQLERVQLSALRIITGTKIGTGHFGLYRELDLPKLNKRRYTSRLIKLHNVFHRTTNGRMNRSDFVTIEQRNPYPSRRQYDLTIPMVTTELCRRSFKNAGIRDWNALPESIRTIVDKTAFKKKLRCKPQPDPYYEIEDTRKGAILLCRMRCGNPDLNYNLYMRNLCESPSCECGEQNETIEHYLMDCPLYNRARQDAKNLLPANAWNCRDLLHGSKIRYDRNTNVLLSKTTQQFIISTNRFQ